MSGSMQMLVEETDRWDNSLVCITADPWQQAMEHFDWGPYDGLRFLANMGPTPVDCITLDPDITGVPPYVKHSVATGSGGALFSPGTMIDGTDFSGCEEVVVVPEKIHVVQGNGNASPMVGQTVTIEGITY